MDILVDTVQDSLWVAGIDKNQTLQALELDPQPLSEGVRWGALFWAKVTRIDLTMNAAFLDLGSGYEGLLHAKDFRRKSPAGILKNEGKPIGKLLKAGDMVFVQAKAASLPLHFHDSVDALEYKIAKMSMDIAIPGRHLLFTPMDDEKHLSARIKGKKLRDGLLAMLAKIETIEGCILRHSATNVQTEVLIRESKILKQIWENLKEFQTGHEPYLIMEGPDAVQRLVGNISSQNIDRILCAHDAAFAQVHEWCDIYAPDLVNKVIIESPDTPSDDITLMHQFMVTEQIEDLVLNEVSLPDGGNIIIEQTSALTSIDVNLGLSKNKSQTNLEAAKEAARQIRLRNIAGIILIDFINTRSKQLQTELIDTLKRTAQEDSATVDVHNFTKLGLCELSRARRTPTLAQQLELIHSDMA